MNIEAKYAGLEVGYDVPALPGMSEDEIQTPCLILDLDALERNIRKMGDYARAHNMRHRAHGKMHKSVDVLRLQQELGGAIGVCCQKVSEAEVFARAGIKDVLVSNQVRDLAKIDRLARLPRYGARIVVCVDDLANVDELSAAAEKHGTILECFVEIDCGAGRCGVNTAAEVVAIAKAIEAAPRPQVHRHPGLSRKRTLGLSREMSALCQKWTHALQQNASYGLQDRKISRPVASAYRH